MAYSPEQLLKLVSTFETEYAPAHERWRRWDELVRRETVVDLPDEITGGIEPVQYHTAILEKDVYDNVEILRDNPTRWDAFCYDPSESAKKLERKVVLWLAAGWAKVNSGRWWDVAVGEGQVRHGVKVTWHRWHKNTKKFPFFLSNTNIYGMYWRMNQGEVDLALYRYKVPVLLADVSNSEGKRVTLDSMGNIGWLGEHEEHDSTATNGKHIEVIVCDYRSLKGEKCPVEGCDHPLRYITVYVCKEGAKMDAAQEAETYVSPFEKCSFKVTGGRVSYHETTPLQKHRPLMLPEYDAQEKSNYFNTLMNTEIRQSYGDEDMYLDYSQAGPHIKLPEGGAKQTFERPRPGSAEMAAYPGEIKRFPKMVDPHLMEQINKLDDMMAEFRPNRFMTGNANKEASNATGTAFLASMQQAGLPYNGLLTNSDTTIKEIGNDWLHALKYWAVAEVEGVSSEYAMPLTGEEQVMRYGRSVKRGELISLNPKTDLKYDFEIVLKTESRTKAEQQAAWLLAWDMYDKGVYTPEDLMKEAGIFDIDAQEEALYAYHVRQVGQPMEDQYMVQYIQHVASALSGIDYTQNQMQPQGPPQQGQQPLDSSLGETNITVPPNAQMGRSARQLEIATANAAPSVGGGSEAGY